MGCTSPLREPQAGGEGSRRGQRGQFCSKGLWELVRLACHSVLSSRALIFLPVYW
jgi:hypothetical protein